MGSALTVVLAAAWLATVAVTGGWAMDTSAADRAVTGSQTLTHLDDAFDAIRDAEQALAEDEPDRAARHLAEARPQIDAAEQALDAERPQLDDASIAILEQALQQARQAHDVRAAEADWQANATRQLERLEAGDGEQRGQAIAHANELTERGEALQADHGNASEALSGFVRQHPLVAGWLPLPVDASGADRVDQRQAELAHAAENETVELAFTRAPDERATMPAEARQQLDRYNPERLRTTMASFDEDGDERLDPEEAVAFYDWVEANVAYRYDDEDAEPDIEGTPVGDGREGTDYQQSPLETYDERMGDCEDTATLQLAFYRYWGKTAYLSLTNTDPDEGITHANLIVRVDDLSGYPEPEEGFHTYEFGPDNEHGIEAGTYVVVDNTYSDEWGTISGGVEPGTFDVLDVETLPESMAYTDAWRAQP